MRPSTDRRPDPGQKFKLPQWWIYVVWALMLFAALELTQRAASPSEIPYSDFRTRLEQDQIAAVEISATVISITLKEGEEKARSLKTIRVEDPELLEDLRAHSVAVTGVKPPAMWAWLLPWLLPGILLIAFLMMSKNRGMGILSSAKSSHPRLYAERDVPVKFDDVAGVDEAKQELREVLDFLRAPDRFLKLGGKLPKGILLVGPPGTGKTLLARAVAGEANVPFFSISGSEFVELFVGVGAARVRDLFEKARQIAPCIIFIDELDALGKVRGVTGMNTNEEREQTLNQLLVELDGFDPRTGVVLMAATNRPEILDPALLRAGRFDRHVVLDRPDRTGRRAILAVHAKKIPMAPDADLDAVAALTAGVVGADLANLLNEAALQAVRNGRDQVGRIELDEAVERTLAGTARRSRVLSPDEKRRVAHHEAGHTIVARHLPGVDPIRKVSILPRGVASLGFTLQTPTEDHVLLTRSALENRIAVLMGGRVAEKLWLDEVSTGAQDDLVRATQIARAMVRAYGMSEALGPLSLEHEPSPLTPLDRRMMGERHDESEALAQQVDHEVRQILDLQEKRVSELLARESGNLSRLARALIERESLTADDLNTLLGPVEAPGEAELPVIT